MASFRLEAQLAMRSDAEETGMERTDSVLWCACGAVQLLIVFFSAEFEQPLPKCFTEKGVCASK